MLKDRRKEEKHLKKDVWDVIENYMRWVNINKWGGYGKSRSVEVKD